MKQAKRDVKAFVDRTHQGRALNIDVYLIMNLSYVMTYCFLFCPSFLYLLFNILDNSTNSHICLIQNLVPKICGIIYSATSGHKVWFYTLMHSCIICIVLFTIV